MKGGMSESGLLFPPYMKPDWSAQNRIQMSLGMKVECRREVPFHGIFLPI